MRRGCLFGCGGWLLLCVVLGLLGWFVAVPRALDSVESGLSDSFATMVADEISPIYSRSQLQDGADVPFSFAVINDALRAENDDVVDTIVLRSSGTRLIIEANVADQTFDVSFEPRVSAEGTFQLDPVDDGGWWQRQFQSVLAGGFEGGVNEWLDRNNLRLVDVYLEGDTLILSVTGR